VDDGRCRRELQKYNKLNGNIRKSGDIAYSWKKKIYLKVIVL
jgi:hypothetical protein